jgi:ABC-type Fe3+ transport system permease subunit
VGSAVFDPFLTPPYISALSWMLALQSQGYLQHRLAAKRSAVQPQRDRAGDDL